MAKLSEISKELATLISYGEFKLINMLLVKVINKLDDMPTEKVLTYIKATYQIRNKLTMWGKFISEIEIEFNKRKLDSNILSRVIAELNKTK